MVLDVKQGEATWILLEVLDRTNLTANCPIDVHFEEHLIGIGMLYHIVVPNLVLYLAKLVRVVVVAELHARSVHHFAYFVQILADNVCFCKVPGIVHTRIDDVLHASALVSFNAFCPPTESAVEVARLQLVVVQVVTYMT